MIDNQQWHGFEGRTWKEECNVRDFIQKNYHPYDGDESFLAGPTDGTNQLWTRLQELQKEERNHGGVLDEEADIVSFLLSFFKLPRCQPDHLLEALRKIVHIFKTYLLCYFINLQICS